MYRILPDLVGSEAGLAKQMRMLAKLTSWKYTLFRLRKLGPKGQVRVEWLCR